MNASRAVRLEVWGHTDRDRQAAEHHARLDPRLRRYRIESVEPAELPAPANTGHRGTAIASHAVYGRTWAAYLLPEDAREEAA